MKDHHVWLQDTKVDQGVILPDRRTAPLYAQYNDLLLQGPHEDFLEGMRNHQKLEKTMDDEKESKGFFSGPTVPHRLFRGSTRALQGTRGTISLSLLQDSIQFLEGCDGSDEVGEKRNIERTARPSARRALPASSTAPMSCRFRLVITP